MPDATTTADAPVETAAAAVPEVTVPATEADGKKRWLIVAGGQIPTGVKAAVIVCESWSDPTLAKEGEAVLTKNGEDKLKTEGYPTKADLYVRSSPEVEFKPADGAPVITLGENAMQTGFWGFDPRPGNVRVGPAHLAYAAANIAAQRGATDIEIIGLTDRQADLIQPFLDNLPVHANEKFRSDVKVTITR